MRGYTRWTNSRPERASLHFVAREPTTNSFVLCTNLRMERSLRCVEVITFGLCSSRPVRRVMLAFTAPGSVVYGLA